MQKIRYWAFPAWLVLAWILSSIYTIHSLVDAENAYQVVLQTPAASSART